MMVLIGAAAPTWRYVMQDDREQELFFRGDQIARGVEEYQRKNGNAFPPSFEVLVKGKFLRREYKDPMTRSGKWRILHPGEAVATTGTTAATGTTAPGPGARPSPSPSAPPSAFGPTGGTSVGAIAGVVSLSHDTSLRLFNGRTRYDEWIFLAGQPRQLGKVYGPQPGAGGGLGGSPGNRPRPSPRS
jgi:hypothetical protein